MKKILPIVLLAILCTTAQSQVLRVATSPSTISAQVPGFSQVSTITTKTYSYTPSSPPNPPTPVDEDSTTEDDKLYRYADNISVSINMSDGNITNTSIGKVWTLRISIPNALNLGFVFNQFTLSANAEMYIFDEEKTVLDSAIKQSHFSNTSQVGIFPLKGNSAIIYIVEPNNFNSLQSSIAIQKIEAGFQEIEDVGDTGGALLRASINCNPMIMCQTNRLNPARAVARFVSNGHVCTGTLLNNENNNGRAFFLTAFHCIDVGGGIFGRSNGEIDADEIAALANSRSQFQFWKTTCNGNVNNVGIQFTGAIIRASWRNSDVVLLELVNPPGIGDGVNYAGWNKQTNAPSDNNSYIIHHPQGEDMRVTSTKKVKDWFWNNMFWSAKYSSGTVTGGSSGSALFNEYGQVVGQLRGGWSSCNYTDFADRYGKFNHSWNGAGLQQWLSPTQNLQESSGLDLTQIPIIGNTEISCSAAQQYYVRGGLEGCNYQWSVSSNLIILSGQNTSAITVQGNQANSSDFFGTITCTLSTPGKGRIRTLVVTKTVTFPTSIINGYYSYAGNTAAFPLQQDADGTNEVYPGGTFVTITSPETINATWSLIYGNPTSWNWNANYRQLYIDMPQNEFAIFRMTVVTSCGTATFDFSFYAWIGAPYRLSPNPASSNLVVSIDEEKLKKQKVNNTEGINIREVVILDKFGNILQRREFGKNIKQANLNVSTLKPDFYLVRIFNGKTWTTLHFVKQ